MRCRHHPTGIPGINRQQALFGAKELSTRVLMQGVSRIAPDRRNTAINTGPSVDEARDKGISESVISGVIRLLDVFYSVLKPPSSTVNCLQTTERNSHANFYH